MRTATRAREHPIDLSTDEVQAILEGRKTQLCRPARLNAFGRIQHRGRQWHPDHVDAVMGCPYGQPGDRLWARERWTAWPVVGAGDLWEFRYAADSTTRIIRVPDKWEPPLSVRREQDAPARHLPRWASRITLEIVDRRLEALMDLTTEDALAEGFLSTWAFWFVWDEVYGKRGLGLQNDPLVWVIKFKRVGCQPPF